MIPEAMIPKDWPGLLGWLRRLRQTIVSIVERLEKVEKELEKKEE